MLYNLRNGSTINIKTEKYFDMTDADLEKLELYYRGAEINDPFFGSVIVGRRVDDDVEVDELDVAVEELEEPEKEEE